MTVSLKLFYQNANSNIVGLRYWETLYWSVIDAKNVISTIILRSQKLESKTERVSWRNIYREANNILEVICSKSHYVCIFKQEGKKNKSIPATIPGVGASVEAASTPARPRLPPTRCVLRHGGAWVEDEEPWLPAPGLVAPGSTNSVHVIWSLWMSMSRDDLYITRCWS